MELNGGQHDAEVDTARTQAIERHGYRVIRFWNHEALDNLHGVIAAITQELALTR